MTEDKPTSSRNLTVIIGVLAGLLILVGGVLAGVLIGGGGPFGAPATTTTLPPTTTTTVPPPPTTTTVPPPPTTTTTAPPEVETETTIEVSEDTTVDSDDPGESKGDNTVLEVDQDGDDVKRALLRFEVSEIPEGQEIISATLRLLQLDESAQGGSVSFVGGPWTEAETTWSTAPPVGEVVAPLPGGVDGTVVEIDVTEAVTGNGTYDFYLTTLFNDAMDYASKESGQGPTLLVRWGDSGETAGTATLVGAGDIASCVSGGDETTARLVANTVSANDDVVVFTSGDNVYESGTLQQFNDCYDPSWGQFKDITRPTPGAREYRTAGAAGYFAYFGSRAGDSSEGYYSYQLGGWHVIALNSNCDQVGGCEEGSPQEQWLDEELEESSTACTLAYWHHPLFSSASGGGTPAVRPFYETLMDADAEIVINGDNHFYERFEPQTAGGEEDDEAIRQFTVGTGGRSLEGIGDPAPNSAARYNESFGVLALTLFPGGYEWDFVTEQGVTFADRGTGSCQ